MLKLTETELREIVSTRDEVAVLRSRLATLEKELTAKEEQAITKIKHGAKIEGKLTASVHEEEGPRRPQWKNLYLDHFAKEHGEIRAIVETKIKEQTVPSIKEVLDIAILL